MARKTIALSLLGTQKDYVGKSHDRWSKWRPNISLCSQQDLIIDELHLLHENHGLKLAQQVVEDIAQVSPETRVVLHAVNMHNPWDFEEVYARLFDWCAAFEFDAQRNDYLFHITTGTHVNQICAFLLTESRHFPGRLIQTSPDKRKAPSIGKVQVIDLDLSRYDQLANRFDVQHQQDEAFLKAGIQTLNPAFNTLISQIEKVALRSKAPMLLTGPTGAGKSALAERIYLLKHKRGKLSGEFVAVNCATLQGENAMAALFGHTKGAFTGAVKDRAGFLRSAHHGVLFLDEIGELGLEEQAMLLHAMESKRFYPVGSDKEVASDFQLIAGTNRDLKLEVMEGRFREDLLARINLWSFELPALKDRKEDIAPNLEHELNEFARKEGHRVEFNKEARDKFLRFATSDQASWDGNFRDLNAAVTRMSTLADGSRIRALEVEDEIQRLSRAWSSGGAQPQLVKQYVSEAQLATMDSFDLNQLEYVLGVCQRHPSLASAGRELFQYSRLEKTSTNDSARLQKYLAKFGVRWGKT